MLKPTFTSAVITGVDLKTRRHDQDSVSLFFMSKINNLYKLTNLTCFLEETSWLVRAERCWPICSDYSSLVCLKDWKNALLLKVPLECWLGAFVRLTVKFWPNLVSLELPTRGLCPKAIFLLEALSPFIFPIKLTRQVSWSCGIHYKSAAP